MYNSRIKTAETKYRPLIRMLLFFALALLISSYKTYVMNTLLHIYHYKNFNIIPSKQPTQVYLLQQDIDNISGYSIEWFGPRKSNLSPLQKLGKLSYQSTASSGPTTIYHFRIGPFDSLNQAQDVLGKLQTHDVQANIYIARQSL